MLTRKVLEKLRNDVGHWILGDDGYPIGEHQLPNQISVADLIDEILHLKYHDGD